MEAANLLKKSTSRIKNSAASGKSLKRVGASAVLSRVGAKPSQGFLSAAMHKTSAVFLSKPWRKNALLLALPYHS